MGMTVYSFLWVMQDINHQPYDRVSGSLNGIFTLNPTNLPFKDLYKKTLIRNPKGQVLQGPGKAIGFRFRFRFLEGFP